MDRMEILNKLSEVERKLVHLQHIRATVNAKEAELQSDRLRLIELMGVSDEVSS